MSARPRLIGFKHSVYTRAARIALAHKGVPFEYGEHDPFSGEGVDNPHPFGRVPVLSHNGHEIYETAAITTYLDEAFDGPELMPRDALERARVTQVIGMVDAYAYWVLVRQVFSHGVFRPAIGAPADRDVLAQGLRIVPGVLAAFDEVAQEGAAFGRGFTRADCHLIPMIGAFVQLRAGAEMLRDYPALSKWWARVSARDVVKESVTPLPSGKARR